MNKRELVFWKWSVDEPHYKSPIRPKEPIVLPPTYDTQQNAINQSLEFDTIPEPTFSSNSTANTREELDDKMAGRDLVLQRGANPFMQQTSYVNDIVVRDMFLKPINTTQGRTKNAESSTSE